MQPETRYLDEVEVAELTGRKVQTLRNDRFKRQGLPYVKLGRSVRYSYQDVVKFMEARKVETRGI
jgi:predicted DNA-binding transcriptional regulator AlpA